jgi:hypothetical protein
MIRHALAASLVLAATAAAAHHGFTGRYDTDRPIWLTGTVAALSASPPHPTASIRVDEAPGPPPAVLPAEFTGTLAARPEDGGRTLQIEFPPVGAFYALGQRLRPGDRVAVMALRNCRPPHQLRSQWIRLPDGAVVQREGRLSYMGRGCDGG